MGIIAQKMDNVKKYWIISGTLVFVILFSFLIVEIYTSTLDGEKNDYKMQQLEMAKNAASGITYFIDHLANDLRFLSEYPEIKNLKLSSLQFTGDIHSNNSGIIRSMFLADTSGRLLYSSGQSIPDWSRLSIANSINLYKSKNKNDYIVSEVSRDQKTEDNKNIYFQILVPVSKMRGYLGYILDFNSLIEQYIKPLKLSKEDFAFIIDSSGTLIYHPQHQEMLFYSINKTTEECYECHISFDMQHSMLKSDTASSSEYRVIKDEPPKLMTYFPIVIRDQKWVLVLSASVPKVTENLRNRFQVFFILGFIILAVIILFSLIIYYINLKRILAEEARKNIEEVQTYQEQLNQASKLASIGELVDSVAHEINTPAGIIAAHADSILLSGKEPENISEVLQLIKRQTKRISDYTRSLLNYSQRMPFNPEPVNLKHLLDECIYLLGHRFRAKQVSVLKEYEDHIPYVMADYRQVEQVFINVINNAVDASFSSGKITFGINCCSNDIEGVMVTVKDEGKGILPGEVDKIFTPFFSTKLNSNGTGLGLSIARAIMTRHNGTITAESIKGKGTSFKMFFPKILEDNIK